MAAAAASVAALSGVGTGQVVAATATATTVSRLIPENDMAFALSPKSRYVFIVRGAVSRRRLLRATMVGVGHLTGCAGEIIINSQSITEMVAVASAADVDWREYAVGDKDEDALAHAVSEGMKFVEDRLAACNGRPYDTVTPNLLL